MSGPLGIVLVLSLSAWPASLQADAHDGLRITMDTGAPYYQPPMAVATPETVINWRNSTPSTHTIRHDDCATGERPCFFDSGIVPPGGMFTVTSLPPGWYPYHCQLHPIMRGVLMITENAPAAVDVIIM